ncbi:uncharacterized protein LOC108241461 [Kryptolebias marmoratus]|uniref:uncharacterized protein LOC108241461 n=1 Tax=Kryptolebias marmoratus TaxID=37003 RepID=UPI0018AC8E99|nr:uncharacterized protein LOC108241461 [Kryptolebias marmoratus]
MKIRMIITIIFLLDGLWETEALKGEVGQAIMITCSHSNADTNVKYFCKGECYERDILITSRKSKTDSNEKYSIKDEGNTFYVTISDLQLEDSGTYWCGIERVGIDTYNKVIITVKAEEKSSGDHLKSLGSQNLAYIGAGLSVVLLVLVAVIGLFFRLRKRDRSTSSENNNDMKRATPSTKKKSASVNGDQEMKCRSGPPSKQHRDASRVDAGNIYSNVSSETQTNSDDLSYATVSFRKNTDCTSVTSQTESTTYSSVKYEPKGSCNTGDEILGWKDALGKTFSCGKIFGGLINIVCINVKCFCCCFVFLMIVSAGFLSASENTKPSITNCKETENFIKFNGESVTIDCKYPQNNMRYFCTEELNMCYDISSSMKLPNKFSLTSDNRQVIISKLTEQDSGRYWCGVCKNDDDDDDIMCSSQVFLYISNRDTFDLMKLDYVPSQTAHIACKYSDRWKSGTKVLCKETRPFVCKEIINTTQEAVGRFHIKDNKETNSFSVDIKNLTEADSGIYWCLSGKNEFVATELSVASNNVGMIAGITVCLVGILVVVTVLILCRRKLPKTQVCCAAGDSAEQTPTQNTEAKNADHHYDEIQDQQQQPKTTPNVYATISRPADQMHYATVDFQNDANSLDKNPSFDKSESHPPAEITLYSTVRNMEEQ